MKPKILVMKSALLDMVREALDHPRIETAWGLYGFLGNDMVLVSGVIRPSNSDIHRELVTTSFGGEQQAAAFRWLSANASFMRRLGVNPADMQFAYLFKGHSHHRLGVDHYSATDYASIREAVEVDGLEVAIGPLVTLREDEPAITPIGRVGTLQVDSRQRVWVRFYYLSKEMVAAGQRQAVLAEPEVIDHVDGLTSPPLSWAITRESEFIRQLRLMRSYGCQVQSVVREIHNGPPFEIQFLVQKPAWRGMLSIVTDYNYPESEPQFEVIPTRESDAVVSPCFAGREGLESEPLWVPGMELIEAIFRLEARGAL